MNEFSLSNEEIVRKIFGGKEDKENEDKGKKKKKKKKKKNKNIHIHIEQLNSLIVR